MNINEMSFDDFIILPNVSPIDVFYVMDPSLAPLGGSAGPFLTFNSVMTLTYGLQFVDDTYYDLDPACLADGDISDCSGRIVANHPAQCYRVLEERQVYIDFLRVGSNLAGDANLDGGVDVLDVVLLVNFVLNTNS